jgi:phosphatidylglycerophosphatase A
MNPIKKFFSVIISSSLYVGFIPFIPGTFGSLAGLVIYYAVRSSFVLYLGVILLVTVLGFLTSGTAEKALGKKDARYIVIDEVSGMLISLFMVPFDLKFVIIGFFLFRLLDTLKPYPAWSLQKLKGSAGVMSDDIVAAIYTNLILQAVVRLAILTGS